MSYISREEARLADAIRAEAVDPKTNKHTMQPRDAYAEARRRLGISHDDYLKDRSELARHGDPIAVQQAREEEMRLNTEQGEATK